MRPFIFIVALSAFVGCRSDSEGVVRLTPAAPSASGTVAIVAPGAQRHQWSVVRLDTTAFGNGGTLEIEVTVAADSATAASFDLFPQAVSLPTSGYPTGYLAYSHDVGTGQSSRLTHKFTKGEVFTFASEGNWFSAAGAKGTVQYRVTVR
jgi:hypothetical protein